MLRQYGGKIVYKIKTMSIYGELDPMPQHRTQFAFKGKREHIVKVNIPNITYPNQHSDIEIPHGPRDDYVFVRHNIYLTATPNWVFAHWAVDFN